MAKAPVAGRVKTRLAAEAGLAVALRFARHRIAALVQRMQGGGAWHTLLAVTPDSALPARIWPPGVRLVAQGGGDLGARMQRLVDLAPPGPVVIIGTDIPGIAPAHIAAAFCLLGRHDAVLGPAADGGYWLIGLKRRPHIPRPFAGVRWSGAHALADTLANLRSHSVALLPTLRDVDTADDLAAHAESLGRHIRQYAGRHPISVIP
ncbi:MAG TPA: TIGR04282 family arsenosugar biosynthesis glycosyltransferase [Hyphomicrobiaceae bacterium]|nr:TIGR04282 family arsenosugar biosynthesis glycosyltransferase [Hyphomicrobiaceae bacterium]